ncbi:sperm flagellar protein 2-like [Homalodisca vitripennis]|uniref:sperm flagellar protein 2-like n=1 Tax=Homalodisca vitripennis TaxID=197043 RepID=UPI001EEBABB1|nr:sperm flagellar protein 2-like [Homalodisca vitripennis]
MQNDLELEVLPTNILEMLYKDQEIYKEFIYDSFDITTIKKLARMILNDDGIEATNSIDLFGEEFLNKLTKGKQKDQKRKKSLPSKKQKLGNNDKKKGRKSKNISEPLETNVEDITKTNEEVTNLENMDIKTETTTEFDLQSKAINPGEQDWQYISLPINNQIAVLLATEWENIENCYINNLLDIFFENRMISLRLVPYSTYVQEEVKTVMNKDDLKQNVVDVFQNYYNNIERHLRELPDVKNQLHCKVLEMQQNLWQLADDKKEETESKRQEVIFQNWLVTQLCMLINNYLSFVQTELTRSIETMKLINDYYLSMLNRDLPSNINLQTLNLDITKLTEEALLLVQDESAISLNLRNNSLFSSSSYSQNTKENKNNFVAQSLINCSENEDVLKLLRVHINQEILKAMNILTSTSTIFYNQIKMEENLLVSANKKLAKEKQSTKSKNTPKQSSEKKMKMSTISKLNGKDEFNKSGVEGELLLLEWRFVIDTEIKRFNFRMDLIETRANEDIMEFYCYLESVFCDLHSLILSRYSTEIQNINDLCEYIKFAIEEEITLNLPIVLSRKSFFINIVKGLKAELVPEVKELYEVSSDFSFTINQLKLLLHIFKIAGPNGIIRKQPFCYIIQDLMLFNTGDHQPHLPKMWNKLSESELIFLIDQMFGSEFAIDWRDFIIYNLDIDYPSICDILSLREQFSLFDPDNTEVVSLERFATVKLWFENHLPGSPHEGLRIMLIKQLLVDMFRVDDNNINYTALLLYFCKDYDPKLGLKKALSLSLGKNVIISTEEVKELLKNEEEIKDAVHSILSNIIASIILNREGVVINEISDTESETNVSFNELNENYIISSPLSSIVSSDKSSTQSNLSKDEAESAKNSSVLPMFFNSKQVEDERSWTSRIPVSTVISVFNASFLNQDKTYSLRNIYLHCLEDEADDDHMIEAPMLVNLRCIQKIFALTNKFKISLPKKIFELLNKTEF